jgi:hypothetical protein
MYIGLHVKYRYCCQILMKLEFSRQISEKYSDIKFHESPFSYSMRTDRRTDIHEKANSRSRNFLNAPKRQNKKWLAPSLVTTLTELSVSTTLKESRFRVPWGSDLFSDRLAGQVLWFP